MNVYDISQSHDPAKCYSKTIDEKECKDFEEYTEKVEKQTHKLQCGIFAHKGNFYFTKFQVIDLTEREHDPIIGQTTTICRKTKFKWEYIFLK